MTTVQNAVKDRSKTLRRLDAGGYEWGYLVRNTRHRGGDYFNKVGEGTYEDALLWLEQKQYALRRRVIKEFHL